MTQLALQGAVPGSARASSELEQAGVRRWIYVGDDGGWRLRAERDQFHGVELKRLGPLATEAAARLRDPYLEWIGDLSRANADHDWWASELAAKNVYTHLFTRLCALDAARRAIAEADESTLVVCSTPALLAEVASAAGARDLPVGELWTRPSTRAVAGASLRRRAPSVAAAWARVAPSGMLEMPGKSGRLRWWLDDEPGYRRRVLGRLGAGVPHGLEGPGTCLLVTWADSRSFEADGSYRDPHFGPLVAMLRDRGLRVVHMPRVLGSASFASTAGRLLATGEEMVFAETLLTSEDLRDARRAASEFNPEIPSDATVGGVPVARLAREHIEENRGRHVRNLLYGPLARRLAEAGLSPQRIVIPFEGQAWEQALVGGVRRHLPQSKVVAYDNLNFSRLALSLYPARSELGLRPLPDRIVTNGSLFRDVLVSEGMPSEIVEVGCALRHGNHLRAAQRVRGGRKIVVAGTIDWAQTVELIELSLEALTSLEVPIVAKLHPASDVRAIQRAVRGAAEVKFSVDPIETALADAALLIYGYSFVCYDALAAGVPPVFASLESALDLDQLEPLPELGWRAADASALRAAASSILAMSDEARAEWAQRARAALDEALRPVDAGCASAFLV